VRAAAVQLNSTADIDRNLEAAERWVHAAAVDGAELIVLPEKWNLLATDDELLDGAEPLDGRSLSAAAGWARELGVSLLAGSVAERVPGDELLSNTSVLFGPDGERLALYRKIHMFDTDIEGVSYRESDHERPGEEIVLAEVAGRCVGLTICYDLRFPELFRILAIRGAEIICVPSAFTEPTGRAHWEVLLRARAIENQLAVVAADQFGPAPNHRSWGHSLVVDAWGRVLARLDGDSEGIACADIDFDEQSRIRRELPSLANRRAASYRWDPEVKSRA
jgi:deaminated glutathione amidase